MSIAPDALYQADCRTLMERVESGQIHVVYFDPPWFAQTLKQGKQTDVDKSDESENSALREYLDFLVSVFQQAHRVLAVMAEKSGRAARLVSLR